MNAWRCALVLLLCKLASGCGKEAESPPPMSAGGSLLDAGQAGNLERGGGGSASGGTNGGTVANGGSVTLGGAAVGGRNNAGGAPSLRGGSSSTLGGSAGAESEGGAPAVAGGGAAGNTGAECGRCTTYAEPVQAATVAVSALNALSGLAVSPAQPDILFAHNDHDRPVVYALDLQGREHARITLSGAAATDIEDITIGPCGTGTCVYLADVGDNNAQRSEYAILRFALPTVPTAAGSMALSPEFERFRFTYEDASHNAESLMVSPDGTLYIVTKLASGSGGRVPATGPSSVYRLAASSLSTTAAATASKVATLSVPSGSDLAASAAAAHPCGLGFLLRTYDKVYEFTVPSGMGFEAAFSTTPKVVATPNEPQSEGIDYRADGRGFISSGEGSGAPIFKTDCAP